MSDQPTTGNVGDEIAGLDETLDPADRQVRIGSDETDDLPVTPPDMQPRATERELAGWAEGEETIDERIAQEVPDPATAYGAPDDESGSDGPAPLGGNDPDAIAPEDDFVGDDMAGDAAGDVTPEGYPELGGRSPDAPAEEAAMHVEGGAEG